MSLQEPGPVSSALADRAGVLAELTRHLAAAWDSFDRPRPAEPQPDAELVERLSTPLPDAPSDARGAIDDAVHILDASVSPARPLYLGYIGSTGLEVGALGGALASAYDANLATVAGAADLLDRQTVRWVAELVGFPGAVGHFTSGGQTSNLTALLAAREQALPGAREHGVGARRGTVYCSAEAHHSIERAVEVAGLGRSALRRVALDEQRRMRPDLLASMIADDRAAGFIPVAVVATAGTTLTGTVDPIAPIADVCAEFGVWLHVDGAYGLPAAATDRARHLFAGLERVDSATVDAHKWLGMQKSCSLILVRDSAPLRAAFGHAETYLLHDEDTANAVDHTLEYSRPFNSLRLWLSLRVHGADQFRAWLTQTLDNAELFAALVREHPEFELLHEPMLSTVCFRHTPDGVGESDLSAHNERLAWAMQRDGRIYLAPASVDGRGCLRVCFVNFRTSTEDVRGVLDVIAQVGSGSLVG